MDIRSIAVAVDFDETKSDATRYAIDLARSFNAKLIGVGAHAPTMAYGGLDNGATALEYYTLERTEIDARLKRAGEEFRALVPASVSSEWRAYVADPTQSIISVARLADIIVAGSRIATGELVVGAGRPVLAVGEGKSGFAADRMLIGWKDTREARRAVADALPFLKRAKDVVAVTISEGEPALEKENLDDLLAWLRQHEVSARAEVLSNKGGHVDMLESAARAHAADLVVAGAYGHTRMREWLFGGMTRNLIEASNITCFFSN